MKHQKRYLLPFFTLLLAAAGAAMPFAAAYMQDARQSDPEVRSFDSFSLTLQQQGSDLARLLNVIANGTYYIQVHEAEDAALTSELALAAADDLLTELVEYGLMSKEALARFSGPNVRAQMVVPLMDAGTETAWNDALQMMDAASSTDHAPEEDAISTWAVTWDQPGDCYIWLDDASGKAVMLEVPCLSGLGIPDGSGAFGERVYAMVENWRTFLSDYYSVEVQIASEEWYDDAVKFSLSFPLGADEDQEIFQLDLYLYFAYHFSTLSPYIS